jgi:fatty acid desaturase
MFARKWKNTVVGFVTADLLLGMSYGWWVQKHNRHHANPNHVDLDPDINNPAIVYTEEQALRRRGPLRLLARYQAYLFFPLLGLLAWSMHLTGTVFLATRRSRYRRLEVVTLLAHLAIYVGFLVYFLGPWSALLVIVIHKAIGGFYLASVFAPNHKPAHRPSVWLAELPGGASPLPSHAAQPGAARQPDRQGVLPAGRRVLLRDVGVPVLSRASCFPAQRRRATSVTRSPKTAE